MEKKEKTLDNKADLDNATSAKTAQDTDFEASKSSKKDVLQKNGELTKSKATKIKGTNSKSSKSSENKQQATSNKKNNAEPAPRLLKLYNEKYLKELKDELRLSNILEVPRLTKIVLNMGVGEAANDRKHIEKAEQDLSLISGQKPVRCYAKISEAGFKLRAGIAIGVKVTLRSKQMYEFLDRLVTIAMPRIRDFQSLNSKSFDGFGNFAFGIKEQIIFPEINYDTVDKVRGFDIVICTTSNNDQHAKALLEKFNMPFRATN